MGAVNTVLPPRCVISGDIVERQGMISPASWAALDFIGDPCCAVCGFPFDFEVDKLAQCGACLEKRPSYESARAALKYNDASRGMILGFKHSDQTHLVRAFMPWLKSAGGEMLGEADILMPVPLHRFRLFKRRYNQSAIIAKALSADLEIKVMVDGLIRTRATPPQGHLKAKERFKNVKSAFRVNSKRAQDIKGKTIVLVDDVYTTGATVRECAKALLAAGAKKVHVLCLARVVRDSAIF